MKDICVLYNVEDVEDFANYLEELFKHGDLKLDIDFQPIGDVSDLKELSLYKILILLCSPCMSEFFDDETEIYRFKDCFVNHPCIICLQYFVEDEAISRLQTALCCQKSWKLFQNLGSKQECNETIANIFDILDEQTRLTPKPPKPRIKIRKSRRPAKIFPKTVYKANEQIAVILQKAPNGTIQISFREFDKIVDANQFNETTFIFRVPPLPKLGEVRLAILCNNEKIADCSLRIVKPNLAAYECLHFVAQSLGVDPTDKQALDCKLVSLFDKSIPTDGTLSEIMKLQTQDMPFQELVESDQEIPTLLHFAAKHGLEDLACTILDTPGSSAAFQIENKDGHDPSDLAELNGYEDLAEHLRTHFDTHTMVEYIHLAMDNIYSNQEELDRERSEQKDKHRSQSLKCKPTQDKPLEELKPMTLPRNKGPPPPVPTEEEEKYSGMKPEEFMGMAAKPLQSIVAPSVSLIGSTTHDELVEIGNAVRNGEFTIDEAERLYTSWVDRNKATQSKSLKQRQKAIEDLRAEYQTVFKPGKQQRQSILTKIKKKVGPRKKSDVDKEQIYNFQITHPTHEKEYAYQKPHLPGRESTISNSSSSSGGSRASASSQESWRDSTMGSMHESGSDSDELEGVYNVDRRHSEPKEGSGNRVSYREQFLHKVQEEEESPSLPPRTSDAFKAPIQARPPPPRKDRLPPPLPVPSPATPTTPTLAHRTLPTTATTPARRNPPKPPTEGRPLPEIPSSESEYSMQKAVLPEPSPISKRPPAPLPDVAKEAKPSYKMPPKPPKKMHKS